MYIVSKLCKVISNNKKMIACVNRISNWSWLILTLYDNWSIPQFNTLLIR